MITDTPRTDAVFNIVAGISRCQSDLQQEMRLRDLSMELERELTASKAEVARLKKELDAWDYGTRAKREQEARKKAEAEVERLTCALKSCWHAANTYDGNYARACDNVMEIASAKINNEINHTK